MTTHKIDPVDVALLVVFQTFLSSFPNVFLSFFPFGKIFGFLIGAFAAGLVVGITRKTKHPNLSLPRERMRLARCATIIFVGLAIGLSILSTTPERPFSPPLLGAPAMETKSLWILTLIGVPVMGLLLFLTTRVALGIPFVTGSQTSGAAVAPPTAKGQNPPAAKAVVPHAAPPIPVYKPLAPLGIILQVLLALSAALNVGEILQAISFLGYFSQNPDLKTLLERINGGAWLWLGTASSLLSIAASILFLIWLHQAYRNLYAWKVQGLDFTPGWAVGWWFIPILNFFKPYQIVRQLWKASQGREVLSGPESWKEASGTPLIAFWWLFWLVSILNLHFTGTAVNPENLKILAQVALITHSAHLAAAILLIAIVRTITQQHEKNA